MVRPTSEGFFGLYADPQISHESARSDWESIWLAAVAPAPLSIAASIRMMADRQTASKYVIQQKTSSLSRKACTLFTSYLAALFHYGSQGLPNKSETFDEGTRVSPRMYKINYRKCVHQQFSAGNVHANLEQIPKLVVESWRCVDFQLAPVTGHQRKVFKFEIRRVASMRITAA